jgi:16S rRNA (uracil1498-N3)-methyltransferase
MHVPKPTPSVGVAFALIKGGRPELVVQKLTELGVDRIVPFTAERSIVRWDGAKADKNRARLQRVAREAVMQCRRAWLPQISSVSSFWEVAAEPGACMADRGGAAVDLTRPLVMVGPEGGWSESEAGSSLPRVRLAEPVLRAETAAIAAGVLLGAARAPHF